MAVGLAQKMFNGQVEVESAGISSSGQNATPKAIQVMHEIGIDITSHRSRLVSELDLEKYDYIIILDPDVTRRLAPTVDPYRLESWNIEDPIGQSTKTYITCRNEIQQHIEDLRHRLRI